MNPTKIMERESNSFYLFFCFGLLVLNLINGIILIYGSISDLGDESNIFADLPGFAGATMFFSILFSAIPIIFSIGLFYRKNWARKGTLVIAVLIILVYIGSLLFNLNQPSTILFLVFYIVVFKYLKSSDVKKEFTNEYSDLKQAT